MSMRFTQTEYGTEKQILMFPNPYVAAPQKFSQGSSLAVDVNGRKIIKAGTIYPANDSTALGIVFSDLDVTEGDQNGAIIVFGFVKTNALPVAPTAAAKTALNMIKFFPLSSTVTYTVSKELVNVNTDNDASSAKAGEAYNATLTAAEGYTMTGATVKVEMNGTDVTSTAYTSGTGKISITSVTGNIVITATAVEA